MYIVQPLKAKKSGKGRVSRLFDTHPPIEERIRKLDEMSLGFSPSEPGEVTP
jgi:Zn-dependent protease with chaperone function